MYIKSTIKTVILLLLPLLFAGCSQEHEPETTIGPSAYPVLAELLQDNKKVDDFYQSVRSCDTPGFRNYLENKVKNGSSFNYGVLLNAGLITKENKSIFQPDTKKIKEFSTVSNENFCYMNSALYNIANSEFFNEFLEIDQVFPAEWNARDSKNLLAANKVLRSLRELIYEIRLGDKTTPAKIAHLRTRHINSLEHLDNLEIIANFYKELVLSYEFEKINYFELDLGTGKHIKKGVNINLSSNNIDFEVSKSEYNRIKQLSKDYNYGVLGRFFQNLSRKSGSVDIYYLDTIFSILDPWGKIARYMTAAAFDAQTFNQWFSSLFIMDMSFYIATRKDLEIESALVFGDKAAKRVVRLIHNAYDLNDAAFDSQALRLLRNSASKKVVGKITSSSNAGASFHLTAKSRHSSNHQIAEIYRYSRTEWETHNFFGAPNFAKYSSEREDGSYKDYMYYFARD